MGEQRRPHAVLVPFPAQGHINPMMRLANKLVDQGFLISFVNTEYNYSRIARAKKSIDKDSSHGDIRWIIVSDGLPPTDTRTDVAKLCHVTENIIVSFTDKLIGEMKEQDPQENICLITDCMASTALDAAKRHGIPMAALWTSLTATYALLYNLPNLVSSSLLPSNGVPKDFTMVKYLPSMPPLFSAHLPWAVGFSEAQQEFIFVDFVITLKACTDSGEGSYLGYSRYANTPTPPYRPRVKGLEGLEPVTCALIPCKFCQRDLIKYIVATPTIFRFIKRYMERMRELKWVLFNSFYYLEDPIIDSLVAQGASVCSIGPFISFPRHNGQDHSEITANFWTEEAECLEWLDKQSPQSVVYVSFGSLAIVNQRQLEEFALGLEATQKPFLWVLRSNLMDWSSAILPPGFVEATRDRTCFVSWCPQTKVLSHPCISCFITHCGWNSVVESIANGVPMLCWPYFADQFLNCVYVVDVWKIGLPFIVDSDGIVKNEEAEKAVGMVVEDDKMKRRVMKLTEEARDAVKGETGSSYVNFQSFVKAMEEEVCDK